jgi:hypothetical protein
VAVVETGSVACIIQLPPCTLLLLLLLLGQLISSTFCTILLLAQFQAIILDYIPLGGAGRETVGIYVAEKLVFDGNAAQTIILYNCCSLAVHLPFFIIRKIVKGLQCGQEF